MATLIDPDHAALRYICNNMRARDVEEVNATTGNGADHAYVWVPGSWEYAQFRRIFYNVHRPVAFVMGHETGRRTLQLSLLATDEWPLVARAVVRWCVRVFKPQALALGYRRAECRAIAGHDDAEYLLSRLGFVCEVALPNYGEDGQMFKQWAWRASDHVFHAENPKAAPGSGDPNAGGRECGARPGTA